MKIIRINKCVECPNATMLLYRGGYVCNKTDKILATSFDKLEKLPIPKDCPLEDYEC